MNPPGESRAKIVLRATGLVAAGLAVACASAWGAGLLYFAGPLPLAPMPVIAGAATIVALFVRRWRRAGLVGGAVLLLLLVARCAAIAPSNDRQWRPEVARLAHATVAGDFVTLHDVRNFEYRSETDFTPRYDDRTFDLRKLDSVDLVSAYWMGPAIAHLFVTFGFGGEYLAVSIEARKESSEDYSTLGGFFRQYELIYIAGDERDLIRLRTNYRKDPPEDVYLMRLDAPIEHARRFFLEYVAAMNSLHAQPRFYNTLLTNCTTAILLHARANPGHLPYSWKILASGYAPEYVYEAGRVRGGLPFAELMRRSRINEAAAAAGDAADFSRRIRAGLPGMGQR